ncbi:MAG: hypothetical protein LBT00_06185 [Spirochaetaceae bacterium]|nr:hypothetical protein [Spirochaetaceae bacterium]
MPVIANPKGEAIQRRVATLDCFALLAMTSGLFAMTHLFVRFVVNENVR